jgi:putative phage-type endonuclease
MEQRTGEWWEAKIGKVGASRIGDIMAKGQGVTRKNYMMELLIARLTGKYPESFTSDAMQWGIDNEPIARSAYEIATGRVVSEVGFILHPTISGAGASPDGMMQDRGLEIKCPNTATHLDTLLSGKIKKDYIYQMQFGMMCAGLDKWDFVSFDPRLNEKNQLCIITVERDSAMCDEIETEVVHFLQDLAELEEKLK